MRCSVAHPAYSRLVLYAVVSVLLLELIWTGSVWALVPGDSNGDGNVNQEDIPGITDQVLWRSQATSESLLRADANRDGGIDIADAIWAAGHNIITFERYFDEATYDYILSVQPTRDGGYILAGYKTNSPYAPPYCDAWLAKTDPNGNVTWSRTFGGSKRDYGYCVAPTVDGGYILVGSTESFGAGGLDAWLIKTDADGNEQWERTFGGTQFDEAYFVVPLEEGGYVLCGQTASSGAGGYDAWLIKTDGDGDLVWERTYGGAKNDRARCVQSTADGGYVITGCTLSFGVYYQAAWIIKTDANGAIVWDRRYGGGLIENDAQSVALTDDGGFVVAGVEMHLYANNDAWAVKLDPIGNEVWERTFGGTMLDSIESVAAAEEGGFVLAGSTSSFGAGSSDAWLIKIDRSGNQVWNGVYGGADNEIVHSMAPTSDGGYILAGYTRGYNVRSSDALLIKTDAEGNVK